MPVPSQEYDSCFPFVWCFDLLITAIGSNVKTCIYMYLIVTQLFIIKKPVPLYLVSTAKPLSKKKTNWLFEHQCFSVNLY